VRGLAECLLDLEGRNQGDNGRRRRRRGKGNESMKREAQKVSERRKMEK